MSLSFMLSAAIPAAFDELERDNVQPGLRQEQLGGESCMAILVGVYAVHQDEQRRQRVASASQFEGWAWQAESVSACQSAETGSDARRRQSKTDVSRCCCPRPTEQVPQDE